MLVVIAVLDEAECTGELSTGTLCLGVPDVAGGIWD